VQNAHSLRRYVSRRESANSPPSTLSAERFYRIWSPQAFFAELHSEFYWVFFEARATNSSNLESKSLRTGDWLDFL
jgi:hypothetical protein